MKKYQCSYCHHWENYIDKLFWHMMEKHKDEALPTAWRERMELARAMEAGKIVSEWTIEIVR